MSDTSYCEKLKSIVMVGMTNSVFLEPTARSIKAVFPEMTLGVLGLYRLAGKGNKVSSFESEYFDLCGASPVFEFHGLIGRLLNYIFYRIPAIKILFSILIARYSLNRFRSQIKSYDVVHFLGLFIEPISFLVLLGIRKRTVITCVGSDVLKSKGFLHLYFQKKMLRRADVVSVSGTEMRDFLIKKYGKDLEAKIKLSFFDPELGDIWKCEKKFAAMELRQRLGASPSRQIVCLGHIGNPNSQHLKLLQQVSRLDQNSKDTLYFVLPMTYGATDIYLDDVRHQFQEAQIEGVLLTTYMSHSELRELRLATDILVYVPSTDLFSGSVSQALAAGTRCILGSWLPYRARKEFGIFYHGVDDVSQVKEVIMNILSEGDRNQDKYLENRALSKAFFSDARLGELWMATYQGALECKA